jgi:tetratricopeptide (TPR) repeat protein
MAIGRPEEAIRLFEAMNRLDPLSSLNSSNRAMIGKCHLLLQRNSEAVIWLSRALAELPGEHWFLGADKQLWLASAHALAGDAKAARQALNEALTLWPGASVQSLSTFSMVCAAPACARMRRRSRAQNCRWPMVPCLA